METSYRTQIAEVIERLRLARDNATTAVQIATPQEQARKVAAAENQPSQESLYTTHGVVPCRHPLAVGFKSCHNATSRVHIVNNITG